MAPHLWVRAECRPDEARTGLMPDGAAALIAQGWTITVEDCPQRVVPLAAYQSVGCQTARRGSWPGAPIDALIFGLKELPDDGTPLIHRHIMFGHAYKGQPAGRGLLDRFRAGGGKLYDLEYLLDGNGRRLAAFGYWAGFAGAALGLRCWVAQQQNRQMGQVSPARTAAQLVKGLRAELDALNQPAPTALIVGAKGRVGGGAARVFDWLGMPCTLWDMDETAHGGPFPDILRHDLFLNCVLAHPGTPVFVPMTALEGPRALSVIADIACDPDSDFSPIKVNDRITTWSDPARQVADAPPLEVIAIDNLPSLLPLESSEDFADQLLPQLTAFGDHKDDAWTRAEHWFLRALG